MKHLRFILFTLFLLLAGPSYNYGQKAFMQGVGKMTNLTLQSKIGFYKNETLQQKINEIGNRLIKHIDHIDEIKFFILDNPDVNAYATFGGYVYISRGLLSIIETEDELAGVIAHELVHVKNKHSTEKLIRNIIPNILKVPANILEAAHLKLISKALKLPVDVTFGPINAVFDRMQEAEADREGAQIAMSAGYNPRGLEKALIKIKKYHEIMLGNEEKFRLLNDHPITNHRASKIEKIAEKSPENRGYTSMLPSLNNMLVGHNPDYGLLLDNNTFVHPKLKLQMSFPEYWFVQGAPESLVASNQSQKATIVASIDFISHDMNSLADHYKSENETGKYLEIKDDTLTINGFKARQISLTKSILKRKKITQTTWVFIPKMQRVLIITGIAENEESFKEIQTVLTTFTNLTPENASKIKYRYLVTDTSKTETLFDFVLRKKAVENLQWIEGINQKRSTEKLNGKTIKWVRSEPYKYEK